MFMIKSVDRVYRILDLLKKYPEGLTHTRIAALLEIPHSSLSALLSDMVEIQYLFLHARTRRYLLGPQLVVLAGGFLHSRETVRIGRPFITRLSQITQESIALVIPMGWDLLFVVRENGPQHIISSMQIGDTAPFHALPAGRAMLACMPAEKVDECFTNMHFKAYTEHTVTDVETLKRELPRIRQQGFAFTHDQIKVGISAFGIPVFDITGKPAAGIDVIVPNNKLTVEKENLIISSMRQMATEFSLQLGFSEDLFTGMDEARNMFQYA
jgi:IclR family transcriptional regulator, KDG regulon repressor